MKLAAVLAIVVGAGTAHATRFEQYGAGRPAAPATELVEAACTAAVELRGAVATVELRQRFVNTGAHPLAFVYAHDAPGAVVTGFAIERAGRRDAAIAVPREPRTELAGDPAVLGPDPAVLRAVDGGYEVIAQPVAPGGALVVVTRYVERVAVRSGGLRVALRGRSAAGTLAACQGRLRVTPGPGAAVRRIRIAGAEVAARSPRFVIGTDDVAIDVELALAGRAPVVWAQTEPLADGWNASLVTVLAPPIQGAAPRRVVFVVDGSRSMELVGRAAVARVVHAIGRALPAGAEVEAVVYDRTATRVLGALRPAIPANLAAIEAAVTGHVAGNGSDLAGALALAGQAIAGGRGPATVVVLTDGVLPALADQALIRALAAPPTAVDVHAIVLDPGHTRSPGGDALRAPVHRHGGGYVELEAGALDDAMAASSPWLRPSWLELAMPGVELPRELRGGAGASALVVHRGPPRFALTGRGTRAFRVAARPGPAAPLAALALATGAADPALDADPAAAPAMLAKARRAHPAADATHALAVVATTGRIAGPRRAMIAGGGTYDRVVAVADPASVAAPVAAPAAPAPTASAIDRLTLERMFRDQLHRRAYACYQRALGRDARLAGTVRYQIRLGRGEITDVRLTGLGDPALDACLIDAAYAMTAPFPDFAVNADDQTIANYPLSLVRRDDHAVVVLGDADSESPIDIDAIRGGVPAPSPRPGKVEVDVRTPLGGLRPR